MESSFHGTVCCAATLATARQKRNAAAFKAISDNKQVAVLAPTTVLAFQHWETFKQRFAAFPVKVEMISRFARPSNQRNSRASRDWEGRHPDRYAPAALERREVRRPRLLVVDEEQRFECATKNASKQMRHRSTPDDVGNAIPATLHMCW